METGPLSMAQILEAAFRIYRDHFRTLVLCVLVVVVPMAILSTLVTAAIDSDAFDFSTEAARPASELDGAALAAGLASAAIQLLLSLLAVAACTRAVGAAYRGEPVDWRSSLGFAARRLLPLVVLSILTGLLTLLGLVVLIVGAIYVGVRLAMGSPVLLLEDVGPAEALRRSWALVEGRWWATFGVLVISALLIAVVSSLLSALLITPWMGDSDDKTLGAVLTTVGTIVSNAVALPLQAAVVTIVYFDLRVRKDDPIAVAAPAGEDDPATFGGFTPPAPPDPGAR